MKHERSITVPKSELVLDTETIYEIRVKGRIDAGRWAQWFDGMTLSVQEGETVISGPIADQAALYGLLSRLRDLALPLLSVERVGGEGGGMGARFFGGRRARGRGINWLLVILYLLLAGGFSTLTVFFTSEGRLHTALALGVLFVALAGVAAGFFRLDGGWGWRLLAWIEGLAAGLTLMIYLMAAGWLPVSLGISLMLFTGAGAILYGMFRYRARRQARPVIWEPLGSRARELSPSERDHAPRQ